MAANETIGAGDKDQGIGFDGKLRVVEIRRQCVEVRETDWTASFQADQKNIEL